MRIAIATDAWYPQPNGVVRVVGTVVDHLTARDHEIGIVSPDLFRTIPCPTYSELPLALMPATQTRKRLDRFAPDAIHVATEGSGGQRGATASTAAIRSQPRFTRNSPNTSMRGQAFRCRGCTRACENSMRRPAP